MKTLILPGYSAKNKLWLDQFGNKDIFQLPTIRHEWEHWTTGKSLRIKHEVSEIIKNLESENSINIIAKSVGTKVLMSLIPLIKKKINKVILCGIPIDPMRYVLGIKSINPLKLLVIQNTKDPFMPYFLIKRYIGLIDKNITVLEKPASSHDYPYFEEFMKWLSL